MAATPRLAAAPPVSSRLALYANVGARLTHYDVEVEDAALVGRGTVTVRAGVQYAWPHATSRFLYVASSDSAPGYGRRGSEHHVTAFRIDPASGALAQHGDPISLPARPIHITTDIPSEQLLVAFNNPSALRVYRINKDYTPGQEIRQPGPIDAGIFAHQVRVTPDNRFALLVTRGNPAASRRAEDPGALKVFRYRNGVLSDGISIAPNGGRNFGPRHLDFHPARPWIYLSLETQNELHVYRMEDGRINPQAAFRAGTLREPGNIRSRQAAGTVHVHPGGRFVYIANRADQTESLQGERVFKGGENSIAVFSVDQETGEPKPIQHIETRGIHPRTFHIDPSGRLLVVQHNRPVKMREGDTLRIVPAGLSVFRVGDDGRLAFVRKYDVAVGESTMFWMGMVPLSG